MNDKLEFGMPGTITVNDITYSEEELLQELIEQGSKKSMYLLKFGFNRSSFGSYCPTNWKECCRWLNNHYSAVISGCEDEKTAQEVSTWVWEHWLNGRYTSAPVPVWQ